MGRSRDGQSTKIHTTVDTLGNPPGFHLTLGQAHNFEGANALLPGTPSAITIADRAYDAQARIIDPLQIAGKSVVIPPKPCGKQPRDYDKHLYRARHLMEQFFNKLKRCRSIATRAKTKPPVTSPPCHSCRCRYLVQLMTPPSTTIT
ncbi:MAG: transposase [Cytophagaceae bacterium]|nr:MAG: transposase [Cytophagaceae bacterium]